jgi:hypothetical protein
VGATGGLLNNQKEKSMTVVKVVIGNSGTGSWSLLNVFAKLAAKEGFRSAGSGVYEIVSPPDDLSIAYRDGLASAFIKKGIREVLDLGFLQHTGTGMRVMPLDIRIEHI